MTPIIILGAGGHGRVLLDILLTRGDARQSGDLTDWMACLHTHEQHRLRRGDAVGENG